GASWRSIRAALGAAKRSMIPGIMCQFWRASRALCATARRSRTGCCRRRSMACGANSLDPMTATADGENPRRGAHRRIARGGGGLRPGAVRGRPFGRRDPQHPRAPARSRTPDNDHDARRVAATARAGRRLRPIRSTQERVTHGKNRSPRHDERPQALRDESAYDETLARALKRKDEPQRFVGDLLKAEISEKQARSIKYQLTVARLPLAKDVDDFAFKD